MKRGQNREANMADNEIWRGQLWRVTAQGLESLDESYWVECTRLNEVRPFSDGRRSDWLLHMAEKTWVDLDDFIAAFCVAIAVYRTKLGQIDIAASIADARRVYNKYRSASTQEDADGRRRT